MKDFKYAKFQLKGFLLRSNVQYTVNDNWSKKHLWWLSDLIRPHHSQQVVLQEMIITIIERMQRLQRLDNELLHQVENWRDYPVVKAVQAMGGVVYAFK